MTKSLFTVVFALLIGLFTGSTSAQSPAPQTNAQEGHRLALSKCDACHIVASDQQFRPLLSGYAPSFYDVANRPKTTAQSLEAFLAHPHYYQKMPYPDLTPAQVNDLVSYILSLRGQK